MVAADLPPGVPIYAIWFGTSGALAALSNLLAGRDEAVRKASQRKYEERLAELNEFLAPFAHVAQTIKFGQAQLYAMIRDRATFEKLGGHVTQVRSASVAADSMNRLTRGGVLALVLHFAAGVTVTTLSLGGVLGRDASDTAILVPWVVFTAVVAAILLAKAIIFQARGDDS